MGRRIGHSRSNPSTPLVSATLNVWTLARSLVMLYNSSSWNEKHPVWTNTKDLPSPSLSRKYCIFNTRFSILIGYALAPIYQKKKKNRRVCWKMCCFFLSFSYELAVGFEKIPTQCTVEIRCVCVCSLIEKKKKKTICQKQKKRVL